MNIGIYNPRVGIYDTGGTETFLREILRELSKTDDVTLYTGGGTLVDEVAELNITIEQAPFLDERQAWNRRMNRWTPLDPVEIESLSMFLSAHRNGLLARMAEREDIVSLHSLLDATLVSRFVDVPAVFRVPAIDLPSVRWRVFTRLQQADRWLTNSEWTANIVEDGLGKTVDGVVYAGVDLDQFSPEIEPAFTSDHPVILYVGRLDPGKGLPELIDAHATVCRDYAVKLVLVGDGSIREALESRVSHRGTTDSVTFIGAVAHQDIHPYYTAADIFCLPSHSEGFGLANIEAMASGVPVVTTNVSAMPEYISNEQNGLLVPPDDPAALSDAFARLLSNPSLRTDLSKTALADVQSFSWSNQAQQMRDQYLATVMQQSE